MEQYISKSALIAEIENLENRYKECPTRNSYEEGLKDGRLIGYKDALYKIDTLEVKDVVLTIDAFIENACEWLEPVFKNLAGHYSGAELLEEFRNYMKGE